MYSTSAINTAAYGIQTNLQRLNDAASRVRVSPLESDSVRGIVDMEVAKHGIAANAAVIKVADQMFGTMVDILV